MNVLISIENNLASSISLRYICKKSQKVSMFIQPIHIEEPTQRHYPFGAGWVRKTWERTLVNTTKDEIENFVKTEATSCRGLTKVKIVVGDKEKEILKELEGEKIVSRREERQDRRIPRAYYSLTPYGKEIVNACKILDDIESRKSSLLMEL